MHTAFQRLAKLRTYVDPNFPGRDWNLATAMVIKGDALLQVMGDWAKGEFINAKKEPGKDFLCFRFPGTQGTVTFNADQFVFFKPAPPTAGATQLALASDEDPGFQSAFNVIKGSAPARTDVPDTAFDACGKKAMADLKAANEKARCRLHGAGLRVPPAIAERVYRRGDQVVPGFRSAADQAVEEFARRSTPPSKRKAPPRQRQGASVAGQPA